MLSLVTGPASTSCVNDIEGSVLSYVTFEPLVIAVTCTPAFVARSAKSIVNGTTPSASPACIVYVAVHTVGPPASTAFCPAIVTVGVPMDSLDVILTVTTSPVFAHTGFALLEAMVTAESVGLLASIESATPAGETDPLNAAL